MRKPGKPRNWNGPQTSNSKRTDPKLPKANKKPTKTYPKLTTICGVSITGSGGARWNVY